MKNCISNIKLNNAAEDIYSMLTLNDPKTDEVKFKAIHADNTFNPKISFIENVLYKEPQIVDIEDVFEDIKNGIYKEQIKAIRNSNDITERRELKKGLPAIMFGGTFIKDRKTLSEASGLVCIDFDHLENMESMIRRLKCSKWVYMFFVSPSGDGLKVIVRTNAKTEEEYKEEIKKLFIQFKKQGLDPDVSKQSINDLCFYSYDPNAYMNQSATIWKEVDYPEVPGVEDMVMSIEHIIDQIKTFKIDISGGELYWDIGLGLANQFGKKGRGYFHNICDMRSDYNFEKFDAEYSQCLKSCEFGNISTLILLAFNKELEILPESNDSVGIEAWKSEFQGLDLNKENILRATEGGLLFYKYLIPDLGGGEKSKKNVKNPLYNDTKGSLSIYLRGDRWYFKDYGEIAYSGDVFDFAKYYYKLDVRKDFYQILKNINKDLDIGLNGGGGNVSYPDFTYYPDPYNENSYEVMYKHSFTNEELAYWNQYGINEVILEWFNVKSVNKIILSQPSGNIYTFNSKPENPIFAYVYSEELIKVYKPFDEKVKFYWIGKKDGSIFFGDGQSQRYLPDNRLDIIITGGEKDVMALTQLDYLAITLNSETSLIPERFLIELKYYNKSVLVLYDTDETGQNSSKFLAERYNLQSIQLPKEVLGDKGKDISDYLAMGGSEEVLGELIESASEAYEKAEEALYLNSSEDNATNNEEEEVQDKNESENDYEDEGAPSPECDLDQPINNSSNQSDTRNENFPYVSNKIIDFLPAFLKKSVELFDNERERDVYLYSSLGVLSGFLPNVFGYYDGHEVFPNLYLLILAPPASNKSVAKWARKMGENLHNSYRADYNIELQDYNESVNQDDIGDGNSEGKPKKPERRMVFIPANSSATAFLQTISKNSENGILFETEADTLGETLAHDWGNYSDSLRKGFHHEPISYLRRTNGELIEIANPKLSVVLSGTPGQVRTLISGVENGLFSRFMFYYFEESPFWKDTFKVHERIIYSKEFEALGTELSSFYRRLESLDYDIKFALTKEQQEGFRLKFEEWLAKYVALNGDSSAATSKRLGLITFRIAMILSMLRLMNESNIPEEVYCSEEDFIVSLTIAENLLEHASQVFKLLPQNNSQVKIKGSEIKRNYYEALPDEFSYQESLEVASSISLKHKTAEKYISDFIKEGILERVEQGKYKKLEV